MSKDDREWFSGGKEPTPADFMMGFALEAWHAKSADTLGPKTREYVKRVHDRSVVAFLLSHMHVHPCFAILLDRRTRE